ncbi:hypothetical protein [Streptomyces sp. CB00455]|uniref:hypothetical protein n=1 Tax=Streptomyces sp. CB00455 TaxID=1703927 RepID=UPI001160F740|nr:hypothetical protein [Streptomyces sp. CB00455]
MQVPFAPGQRPARLATGLVAAPEGVVGGYPVEFQVPDGVRGRLGARLRRLRQRLLVAAQT